MDNGNPMKPFFELDGVSKVFNVKRRVERRWFDRIEAAQVRAVDRVSLRIARGETLAVVGESGSGKSTLANVMSRVTPASEGSMRLDGDELATAGPALLQAFRRRVQMVFQDPSSSLNPRQTVEDIVGLPLKLGGMRSRKQRRARVRELLESVQMPADTLLRTPMSLSGGQKQRINIARALALQPELLILDEPTSALDVSVQARILGLLAALKARHGLTYVVITHDLGVVRAIADRIAVMYLGRIVEIGTADEIMRRPRHPYTRALIGAIPVVHESDRAFIPATEVLDCETPSLLDPPTHCAFHSRCAFREDACLQRPAPELVADAHGHAVRCHRTADIAIPPNLPTETPRRENMNTPVYAPSLPEIRPDAAEDIPVIDLGPYLAGAPGAKERVAAELRHALEKVGFYFVVNHGIAQPVVDGAFEAARLVHGLPIDDKMAVRFNEHNIGYEPLGGSVTRHSRINADNKPNQVEAFFIKRELPPEHPDVLAGTRFRARNRWPAGGDRVRELSLAYADAVEDMGKSLLPLYALALDLPPGHFDKAFEEPMYTLRLSHYPQQPARDENTFGIAPHTDTGFMTFLPFNEVAGLAIRLPTGRWVDVPSLPGAFLINSGDLLRRWSNDRFLSTPHRVINASGRERYAVPFFMDCDIRHRMECLPTCVAPGEEPKYPSITYTEYMAWYRNQNYGQAAPAAAATAATAATPAA